MSFLGDYASYLTCLWWWLHRSLISQTTGQAEARERVRVNRALKNLMVLKGN